MNLSSEFLIIIQKDMENDFIQFVNWMRSFDETNRSRVVIQNRKGGVMQVSKNTSTS